MTKLRKCNGITGIFYTKRQVLKFPQQEEYITDEDINDLFLGLIELVKKNTELKCEQKYENLIDVLKSELRALKHNN